MDKITPCDTCGQPTRARYHGLSRNIERVDSVLSNSLEEDADSGSPVYATTVHEYVEIGAFCDATCWKAKEGLAILEHNIRFPYPDLDGLVANCSRCGRPFNATRPYVALVISDLDLGNNPLFPSADVNDSETLAHFCPDCEPPDYEKSEFETELEESQETLCITSHAVKT